MIGYPMVHTLPPFPLFPLPPSFPLTLQEKFILSSLPYYTQLYFSLVNQMTLSGETING